MLADRRLPAQMRYDSMLAPLNLEHDNSFFIYDFARQHALLGLQAQSAQQVLTVGLWVTLFCCNRESEMSEIFK